MNKTLADRFATLGRTSHQMTRTPLALATVVQAVSPTAASPGDKALVCKEGLVEGWIGGGCVQPAVIKAATDVLENTKASLIRVAPKGEWQTVEGISDFNSGCLSGGTLVIFIEPLLQKPPLTIFGSSPVAVHLAHLSLETGFDVKLACPEINHGQPSNIFDQAIKTSTEFEHIQGDFIVIATQGRLDRKALNAALASNAKSIFMVASAKKAAGLREEFINKGVTLNSLERIKSPAGMAIGATSPAEIAVSILADLVRTRHQPIQQNKTKPQIENCSSSDKFSESEQKSKGCCGA